MTRITGSEAMMRMLQAHGLQHLSGLRGHTSLPFFDALAPARSRHHPHPDARRAACALHGGRPCAGDRPGRSLFKPLTKWNTVVASAAKLQQSAREAFSQMTTGRPDATHLAPPFDVKKQMVEPGSGH
jgi:acetolactate synthase-1/2/3 large subunit